MVAVPVTHFIVRLALDRRCLTTVAVSDAAARSDRDHGCGAVGTADAIEEIIEPFLIQQGFIQRTPRGRLLTSHAFRHLGLPEPRRDPAQFALFPHIDDPDPGRADGDT